MESIIRKNRMTRLIAALLIALMLTAVLPARPAQAASPITEKIQSEAPAVDLKLFSYKEDAFFRVTVNGFDDLMRYLRSNAENYQCSYRYTLHFETDRPFDVSGRVRYYHNKSVEEKVEAANAKLTCKGHEYDVNKPYCNTNSISWSIEPAKWIGYTEAGIKSVTFTIYNVYESRQRYTQTFDGKDIFSDVCLETALKRTDAGSVRVTVPENGGKRNTVHVTVTDPNLANGYTVSPAKGTLPAHWWTRVYLDARHWVIIDVDGRDASSLENMKVTAKMHLRAKDDKTTRYNAMTEVDGASYAINGDTITLSFTAPAEFTDSFGPTDWISLYLQDGALHGWYKIR